MCHVHDNMLHNKYGTQLMTGTMMIRIYMQFSIV